MGGQSGEREREVKVRKERLGTDVGKKKTPFSSDVSMKQFMVAITTSADLTL